MNMINKLNDNHLRSGEFFQWVCSLREIFIRWIALLQPVISLYNELVEKIDTAEIALAHERKNEKLREKNEMCIYRDRLHSKLYNSVKAILYDQKDVRFDDAQTIMKILTEAGKPTAFSENAESAMLTTLGNRLAQYTAQLNSIGAQQMTDDLMDANRQFIALEIECRDFVAAQQINKVPPMSTVRREITPIYRSITGFINGQIPIPSKKEEFTPLITDLNVLTARYNAILASRKRERKEKEPILCDACKQENRT